MIISDWMITTLKVGFIFRCGGMFQYKLSTWLKKLFCKPAGFLVLIVSVNDDRYKNTR